MTRKGTIAEIFSKAVHHDDPVLYYVGFIDLGVVREATLPEFVALSENFEVIPATRITHIRRGNQMLYQKATKK